MKAEIINPFLVASKDVIKNVLGIEPNIGKAYSSRVPFKGDYVNIDIGVTGQVKGKVVFSFDKLSAINIASKMMMGMYPKELNEMSRSAIAELANMICGNTSTIYYNNNISTDISPASVYIGDNVIISSTENKLAIHIPYTIGKDSMTVHVSLDDKRKI